MSAADGFAYFLLNSAIFSEESAKEYVSYVRRAGAKDHLATHESDQPEDLPETKLIFGLADFFKSCDAGNFYGIDMAERLFYRWQIAEREGFAKHLDRLACILTGKTHKRLKDALNVMRYQSRINELEEEKVKLQAYLENALKENEELDRLRQKAQQSVYEINIPASSAAEAKQKSFKNTSQQHTGRANGSIFNKLHEEAMTKLEIKQLNEEIRKRRELQYCTFKPEVKEEQLPRGYEDKKVYDRLAQSNKHLKMQYYDAQKQVQELQYCTFQPDLPKAKRESNHSMQLNETVKVHDRLHKEAEAITQMRQCKAFAKREKEMDQCTFTPAINAGRSSSSQHASARRFEELYQDYEKKKKQQTKNEFLKDEKTMESCTFKPSLLSKTKENLTLDESDTPHYEKLYTKHSQKLILLEQKRKELAEEERKMRQFIAREAKVTVSNKRQANNMSAFIASKTLQSEDTKKTGKDKTAFERLYKMDKVYRENKRDLTQKVMKERGISFTPRTNPKPITFSEQDRKGVIERNDEFLKERNNKISRQVPTELKECTFAPQVKKSPGKVPQKKADFAERLYSYFDVYEKRKEEYRRRHGLDD